MPYIVNTYNGQQIAIVNDGAIDQTTDIKLIGRNYAGFGEILNENMINLMENFSGTTPPPRPLAGQLWYDSANKVLKFYDGNQMRIAGGAEVGLIQPTGLAKGDMWWEEDGEQLYVYNGEDFILVGPVASGGEGVSQVNVATIKDTLANDRTILKVTVQDQVINIVSKDEFTIDNSANPIAGFSAIKKGLNLASKTTFPGMRYWGTADDADNLGGIPAAQYVLNSGLQQFSDVVSFLNDNGIVLGAGSDLKLHITNGDQVNLTNQVGRIIRFNVNNLGAGAVNVGRFEGPEFLPGANSTGSIGSNSNRWANGFFDNVSIEASGALNGNVVGNVTGNVTGNTTGTHNGNVQASVGTSTFNNVTVGGVLTADLTGTSTTATKLIIDAGTAFTATTSTPAAVDKRSIVARDSSGEVFATVFNGTATNATSLGGATADITATSNTIAQRDSDGDLVARKFEGTATAAQFADLAEIYKGDLEYEPGIVLVFGGEEEVTTTDKFCDHRIAGVVSTEPAHLMNSNADGIAVALRGRVPCYIEGPVNKGDLIVTSPKNGIGTALTKDSALPNSLCVLGRSLENSTDTGIRLVEIVV